MLRTPHLSEVRLPNTAATMGRLVLILLPCLLVLCAGCQPKSPEELVAQSRSQYIVELNSWFPRTPEPAAEPEATEGEAAESEDAAAESEATESEAAVSEATEGEAVEGETEALEVVDMGPVPVDIFFDLIVMFDGDKALPGLTVDVSQADVNGAEKKTWRHYLELPSHIKGETKQVSFLAESIDFAEGDQFSVVLEKIVAPEDQGHYQEFSAAAAP